MNLVFVLAVIVFATSAAALPSRYQEIIAFLQATKMNKNKFTLKMAGMSNMKFQEYGHSVTAGQPWGGVTSTFCKDRGTCRITIESGQKRSKEVASWFIKQVGGGSAIACYTKSNAPDSLNFAINGTLKFDHGGKTYTGDNILIAQGFHLLRYNWWIGGPGLDVITNIPSINMKGAMQSFQSDGPLPAKVTFLTPFGCVSHMEMGILEIN